MKSSHGTRRSTLDSFETNLRQFQETNKLLTNIENKLTDIANNSKEGISPYSQAAHMEDSEHLDEPGTSVKGFHFEGYDQQEPDIDISQDSALQRGSHVNNSFNKVQNMKNHNVNARLVYESQPEEYESYNGEQSRVYEYDEDGRSSVIQDNRTEKMIMTPQHDAGQRLSTKNYTSQRTGKGNMNQQFEQAFLEMQAMTNSRKATNKTQVSNSGSRVHDRTAKLESFYQNKVGILEDRVQADEREIYELRKFNEDLRIEVTRLRSDLEKYRQVQSDEIWQNFREQKESLQRGMLGEGGRKTQGERGSQQRGSERPRSTGKKYPQQFEYRKVEKGDVEDMWRGYNERGNTMMTEERQSANRSEAQEFGTENEKLGFLFGLVNGYKQEVDLLKESNLLIQEKLQQEIYYLKKDLDSQRGQNMQLAKALQQEKRASQSLKENSEMQSVKSSKSGKGDFLEQMSKDELAKFTKGLQDSLMNLEEKHKQQVKYNETIQKELNELRVKTKEEVRQFDEAYHKIFDGQNVVNVSGSRREERDTASVRNKSSRKSYKENGVNTSPPVKDKKTSPRKVSPRKISPTRKFSPRKMSPKKSSPRKFSPEKKRTFRDTLDSEYIMHPKLHSNDENERTKRASSKGSRTLDSKRKTSREKAGNKSFDNYDGLLDEIKKVKRTVEGKIAEKSEDMLNKTVTCSEIVIGKYGVPLGDGGKSRKRSKSKGRTADFKRL